MTDEKKTPLLALLIPVILVAGASAFYFFNKNESTQQKIEKSHDEVIEIAKDPLNQAELPEKAEEIITPDVNDSPIIKIEPAESISVSTEPAEPIKEQETLPTLYESDELVLSSALGLSKAKSYSTLLEKVDILHSFIVFTDHVAQGQIISNFSPFIKPEKSFLTYDEQGAIYLDTKSYQRYDSYANIIEQLNIDAAIVQYKRFLPLIDKDYQEMGNESGAFTDTLILAIDNINETPIINEKIELVAPSAMYEFKDSQIEKLNDVQKLMIRMGPENIEKIQKKLTLLKMKLD